MEELRGRGQGADSEPSRRWRGIVKIIPCFLGGQGKYFIFGLFLTSTRIMLLGQFDVFVLSAEICGHEFHKIRSIDASLRANRQVWLNESTTNRLNILSEMSLRFVSQPAP